MNINPEQYWLSFAHEWDKLSRVAHQAGTYVGNTNMGEFFGELADDAGDMWALLSMNSSQ